MLLDDVGSVVQSFESVWCVQTGQRMEGGVHFQRAAVEVVVVGADADGRSIC